MSDSGDPAQDRQREIDEEREYYDNPSPSNSKSEDTVEIIERYERGKPTTYSYDGGKTFVEPPQDTSLEDILRDNLKYGLAPTLDGATPNKGSYLDVLTKEITNWHKQQQIKLIERIEGEVIGKDEPRVMHSLEKFDEYWDDITSLAKNNLRAEQREAINKLKDNVKESL